MQRKLVFLHSFPQTLVLQMLRGSICFPVPKLHLIWMLRAFICQWHNALTEVELLLSITGMILQLWEKQNPLKRFIFARNCRIEPLLFTSEPKWVGGFGEPSQVPTLSLVQWDYLLAKLKSKQPFKRRALLAALIFISSFVMSFSQPLTGVA